MPYPSKRTPEVVAEVLERLAKGEPLTRICRSDSKFPSPVIWYEWLRADEGLSIAYAEARDRGADALAEEALDIADAPNGDAMIVTDSKGKQKAVIDGEAVARSRLRVETRLKLLAKWNPKKYGEKQVIDVGNRDDEPFRVASTAEVSASVVRLAAMLRGQARLPVEERTPLIDARPIEDDGSDLV